MFSLGLHFRLPGLGRSVINDNTGNLQKAPGSVAGAREAFALFAQDSRINLVIFASITYCRVLFEFEGCVASSVPTHLKIFPSSKL